MGRAFQMRCLLLLAVSLSGGCAAVTNSVADGVPVRRLPVEILGRPKSDLKPIPLTLLRQRELDPYTIDQGDVLAIVADDVIAALRRSARNDATDQAGVAGRVGLRFAEVVVGMARFGTAPVVARGALGDDLVAVAQRLPDLGGSNAQRDVFLRTLLVMAADTGNRQAVSALATLRLQQRNRDRFLDDIVHRVHAFRSRRDNAYAATAAW